MTSVATHNRAHTDAIWDIAVPTTMTQDDSSLTTGRTLPKYPASSVFIDPWDIKVPTSTPQVDPRVHYSTMGWAPLEQLDTGAFVKSWGIGGVLSEEEREFLFVVPSVLYEIRQFVVAYLSVQMRQDIDRWVADTCFIGDDASPGRAPIEDPVLAKIDEFVNLPDGWEYGKGMGTLPCVSQIARMIYRSLLPFRLQADAFPCADGSLHLVFYADSRSVELRIEADETIDLSMEEEKEGCFEEVMSLGDIPKHEAAYQVLSLLYHQELFQWGSSDSFIHGITTRRKASLTVHALRTQATELAYH